MKAIEFTLRIATYVLVAVSGVCLVAMMVHIFGDVVMKYFFNRPIAGTAEVVARYYMVAAVFLPLPLIELRNGGISVDLFYNMLGKGFRRILILFAYLGQLAFFSLLAWQSWQDALKSMARGEFVDGQMVVVVWPATFFLPLGFGLAACISVLRIVQVLMRSDWEEVEEYGGQAEADRPVTEVA